MPVQTYFLVAVNEDGSFTTYTELPTEPLEKVATATNYDVYQSCKQIAQEFDTQLLVERITRAVVSSIVPKQETVSDRVKEALKKRNIEPESVQPVD
jgi:hypothetical protein